jgi:predicted DNA-binding transcriptional regulator YafY
MAKGEQIERAFEIVLIFQSGVNVTAPMLAKKFGMSRISAMRWINQASRFLPIIQDGVAESNGGRPAYMYRMLNDRTRT